MFSTTSSSVLPVPLFNAQPLAPSTWLADDPAPGDISAHRMRRTSFQLCISRAQASTSSSSSASETSSTSLVQRARRMVKIGLESCERYRRLADEDGLPDDGAFPAAEEFFADAFARHVDDSPTQARYFTAGWLHDGVQAHDLRDTVAHFDRLSAPATRLASEALARAWKVGPDLQAFSQVLSSFASSLPETHLQPALEGVARALAEVPDLARHRACLAQLVTKMVMRTSAGRAAWSAVADTLFTREYIPGCPAPGQAGKRKRDPQRESKRDDHDAASAGTSDWMSDPAPDWTSESTSDSASDSQEGSPTPRPHCPGPQASDTELQSFILSVMRPASPTEQAASVQASEDRSDDGFSSPARKQGRVTPRARSPKA